MGGAHNKAQLGVSVVGVYSYEDDRFVAYREDRFEELETVLKEAEQIVGFNLIGFDWPVLAAELGTWVSDLPTLDLMLEAQKALNRRISLDSLAQATLGQGKLGSGLDALEYYRVGDWDRLERYCLEDVKLTRDLYEYAKANGQLLYQKGPRRAPVPYELCGESLRQRVQTRRAEPEQCADGLRRQRAPGRREQVRRRVYTRLLPSAPKGADLSLG